MLLQIFLQQFLHIQIPILLQEYFQKITKEFLKSFPTNCSIKFSTHSIKGFSRNFSSKFIINSSRDSFENFLGISTDILWRFIREHYPRFLQRYYWKCFQKFLQDFVQNSLLGLHFKFYPRVLQKTIGISTRNFNKRFFQNFFHRVQ